MFKKTLAAVAVLGAFAGSAFAANVTMYGIIDTGLGYTSTDKGYGEDVNKFDMRSGQNSASRFGVKGEEDLGNGLKVGFSLENGFNSDDVSSPLKAAFSTVKLCFTLAATSANSAWAVRANSLPATAATVSSAARFPRSPRVGLTSPVTSM